MATEISRIFRPQYRDIEVIIEDDFGIRRPSYINLGNGPVDVNAVIADILTETQEQTDAVRANLE